MADINDFQKGVESVNAQMKADEAFKSELLSRAGAQNDLSTPYTVSDIKSGETLPVDNEEDLSLALISGDYVPPQDQIFNVVSSDGRRGTVDSANIKKVLENGQARLETKAETQLANDEEQFGSKNLEAAALGAARGVTFGLSDPFLKGGDFYKGEELRGLESANPVASIAGEVGGVVGQALASGGTSLLAKGASSTLRLSEAVGAKAAQLTAKSLIKSGVQKSTANSIAKRLLYNGAPEIANLAAQGSLQGVGRLITEDTFGTAELNAENLVSYAGIGALFGGTFGAVVGTGKALIPSAKSVLGGAADAITPQRLTKEEAALDLFDLSDAAKAKAKLKMPDFDKQAAEIAEDILNARKPKTRSEFHKAVTAEMDDTGKAIGSVVDEADKALSKFSGGSPSNPSFADKTADSVSSNIIKTVDKYVDNLGLATDPARIKTLQEYGSSFAERVSKALNKEKVSVSELQDLALDLQKEIYPPRPAGPPVALTAAEDSLKSLQKQMLDTVRAEQRDLIQKASQVGDTTLIDKYLALNKKFRTLKEVNYNSLKRAEKAETSALDEFLDFNVMSPFRVIKRGMESYTAQKAAVYGSMEKSLRTNEGAISNMLANLISVSKKSAEASAKGIKALSRSATPATVRSLTSSALATKMVDGKKQKPKNEDEAYNNIIDNASVALTDPESVLRQSNKSTSALFEHAPQTAGAIDAKYLQMMQFIASKNKGSSKKKGAFDIGKLTPVSSFEKAKMNRYLEAIEDPLKVLDKASKGLMSREHMEVIKTLYPQLHQKIKIQTLETIAKKRPNLTYQQKLQMGLLLDLNSHESMDPENIRGLQSLFNSEDSPDSAQDTSSSPIPQLSNYSADETLQSDLASHEIGGK